MTSDELSGETYIAEGPITIIPRGGSAYRARRPTQIKYPNPISCFSNTRRRSEFLKLRHNITLECPSGTPDIKDPLAGTHQGRPACNKGQSNQVVISSWGKTPRNHPRWTPHD